MADGETRPDGGKGEGLVVYAICPLDAIPPGRADAFTLARICEDGAPRAFPILVVRRDPAVFAYVNSCPHEGTPLNFEPRQFFDQGRKHLMCGKHGARFEIETGRCVDGPCRGERLAPVECRVVDGDVCISGVTLLEHDDPDVAMDGDDDAMEIMIAPE
jgi:nitrite reductase/ring-hydroxylating ferredoxin subunit